MLEKQMVPSRFNALTEADDGGVILYNSYTGAIVTFSAEERANVTAVLEGRMDGLEALAEQMLEMGFIIGVHVNEERRLELLNQSIGRTDYLHLAILPTEQCNFRCFYCFEDHARGKMGDETVQGIKNYVRQQAPSLRQLTVSWFGGEPFAAADVIGELSAFFIEICAQYNIEYKAEALTNGYFLKPELFEKAIGWRISHFMITVDGPKDIHDTRRVQLGGGGSYDRILENLRSMRATQHAFEVSLRSNFDYDTLPHMEELIDILAEEFAGDRRFQVFIRPLGCLGGANDHMLKIVADEEKNNKIWELNRQAMNKGLPLSGLVETSLMPLGSMCYCVKPNSFVIGSQGTIHKCSVALNLDSNQVGQVLPDGTFRMDYDKLALWTTEGKSVAAECGECFFQPSCNGNHCKLFRMLNDNARPCSFEKLEIGQALRAVVQNATLE
ncbi:radical SAM protein [Gorillibacterium sp. sgz5001074]|uniref:radical SAM protein n=1 Tax=Gorillibacterium sp. sgz5001074 TaxID=3446695 RepID=UPI003F672847